MNHRGGEAADAVEHSNGARSHRTKWLKHRRLAKVTTAIATAAVVSAVGMGSASVANASVVNLTWWTMWSGSTLQLLNQMTTQFNKTHPGIHVTETNIPKRRHDEHRQAPVLDRGRRPARHLHGVVARDRRVRRRRRPRFLDTVPDRPVRRLREVGVPGRRPRRHLQKQLYAVPMGLNSWAALLQQRPSWPRLASPRRPRLWHSWTPTRPRSGS